MNRRGFFGRVFGLAGGAVAAAATANAVPSGGIMRGPIPPMLSQQSRIEGVFTLSDIEPDSLCIEHYADGWSVCRFATSRPIPELGSTIVVAAPEHGIVFTGRLDRFTIKGEQPFQRHVEAVDDRGVERETYRRYYAGV